jgi:urease accessory protein
MAHVFLMSSAGGVLQGDRLSIELSAGDHTTSRIMTQSATKIYRMDKGYAFQKVSILAKRGSYVEFLPRQLIPFRSSRFCQDVEIHAAADSTVLYSETVSAGRIASAEKFQFEICFLRMRAFDAEGKLLFTDACSIEPPAGKKDSVELLFGGKSIWSTIYVITRKAGWDTEIALAIRDSRALAGFSSLPNDSGYVVRILDDSIDRIEELISSITKIARSHALAVSQTAAATGPKR